LPILPKSVKTILTIHDLNYIFVPESVPFTNLYAHRLFFRKDLMRADNIVCNSEGTASRLKHFFGVDVSAIVRPGVNDFFNNTIDGKNIYSILQKHKIQSPYILTVASLEPRKNLPALIKAFLSLKKRGDLPGYKLILTGGGGWKNKDLIETMKGQQDIVSLGYLEDTDVRALYAGADIFILPSLYEGFGMPVLEARACGSKVIIASDIPELREAGGKETIYITPTVEGIIEGLIKASSFKKQNRESQKLNLHTWNDFAKILASLLTDIDNNSCLIRNAPK
jgi:glycosyltransferase involved in cell wall biosynthesis